MDRNVIYDGMYGLAVADALGVPYESETLEAMLGNPCTGMVGYRHHNQPAGSWSDDTSMTLCVADSLCKDFDPEDMMKKFSQWRSKHTYTATGVVFDIGRCCRRAINRYWDGTPAEYCGDSSLQGNGNGALMRMLPVALFQYQLSSGDEQHLEDELETIHRASSITHAHPIGLICCGLFYLTLREWLNDHGKNRTLTDIARSAFEKAKRVYTGLGGEFEEFIQNKEYFDDPVMLLEKSEKDFPTWGYALNTWNIALWSLLTTDKYRDCVLKAVNLGGDADTNASVAGALAGVIYGKDSIPMEWIVALLNKPLIEKISETFADKLFGTSKLRAVIDEFENEYAFLSMKAPKQIVVDGNRYNDVGSAYYALSVPEEYRSQFSCLGARRARKRYKDLPHLDRELYQISERLYCVLNARFTQHPEDAQKLKDTGSMEIVYNTSGSHDNVLGRCRCKDCQGKEYQNLYGKALMRVRAELASDNH